MRNLWTIDVSLLHHTNVGSRSKRPLIAQRKTIIEVLNERNKNTISYIMYFASGLHISHICNLIDLNLTFDSFCFNHIITEQKQLSDSWFRKWLWYHWRRRAIQGAAEFKILSFSDPYEWAWSVIESLPLVTIETFDADQRSDHERWTMTTPLLSPHEQIPSISVLAGTNEGFEWERERVIENENNATANFCFCTRVLFIEPLVWASS